MSLDIPSGRAGKVNSSNTSVLIILLAYSPSYNIDGSIPSLAIPNDVYLFTPAVLIIYNCIAFNTSCLAICVVRVLFFLQMVAA